MINRLTTLIAALTLSSAAAADCGTPSETMGEADMSGQILVRFADDVDDDEAARIIARIGATEVDRLLDGQIHLIEIAYPSAQTDIITALMATEGVVYAEPNQEVSIPQPPNPENEANDGDSELIPLPQVD